MLVDHRVEFHQAAPIFLAAKLFSHSILTLAILPDNSVVGSRQIGNLPDGGFFARRDFFPNNYCGPTRGLIGEFHGKTAYRSPQKNRGFGRFFARFWGKFGGFLVVGANATGFLRTFRFCI
jgi:hypothetical protein